MAIVCFVLVAVGVLMILAGTFMSVADYKKRYAGQIDIRPENLEGVLTALGKLAECIKTYPPGQQLIVWGIVVLVIAGLFGGISQL
jgi:hypothetical protein